MFLINIKLLTFSHFIKCIFNNVLMNLSFMDFLFYVPFFCTASDAVTEILNVCLVNVEFFERKKLKVKRASHFVKIIVACPHRLPKLPESTQRKQAIPNKGSLFYSHCGARVKLHPGPYCLKIGY
jgi:hypothetical protein